MPKKLVKFTVVACFLVILAMILIPSVGSYGSKNHEIAIARSDARATALAVIVWMNSGGRIKHATTLDSIDLETLPIELRTYKDPESGTRYDWLYYGQYVDHQSKPDETILLATPRTFPASKKYPDHAEPLRVVTFLDGRTKTMTDPEFKGKVTTQIRDFRTRKGWK